MAGKNAGSFSGARADAEGRGRTRRGRECRRNRMLWDCRGIPRNSPDTHGGQLRLDPSDNYVKRPILTPSFPIVLAGLAACTSSLSREKRAWERGRPSSYIFEYQYTCFCSGSGAWWKVAVDGDAVTNVELIDSTQVRGGLTYLRSLRQPTFSGLF